MQRRNSALTLLLLALASAPPSLAVAHSKTKKKPVKPATTAAKAVKKPVTATRRVAASPLRPTRRLVPARYWGEPTFADSTIGDRIEGEDLVVRRAAIEALGPYNGSVVVTDPQTGRVLTIVNQRVAMQSGFTPCSTIKLVTAIAGLIEGTITPSTVMRVEGRQYMDLSMALARSSNVYFANIGRQLGFERVAYYSRLFGLGEKAGLEIEGEQDGALAQTEPFDQGGVGMMTSFGKGISLTPLQLASLLSTIANNGTMYWLQYPKTAAEMETFVPRIKRQLDLARYADQIRPGMQGAVEYGSAKRARLTSESEDPIFGKTGTCTNSDQRTHLGWFGSYNEVNGRRLVVVVLLTGGHRVNGPVASGIAGSVYRILGGQNYYTKAAPLSGPAAELSIQPCCGAQQ